MSNAQFLAFFLLGLLAVVTYDGWMEGIHGKDTFSDSAVPFSAWILVGTIVAAVMAVIG